MSELLGKLVNRIPGFLYKVYQIQVQLNKMLKHVQKIRVNMELPHFVRSKILLLDSYDIERNQFPTFISATISHHKIPFYIIIIPPQSLFVVGILFLRCPCVRPSVTFCFLNILKSHCWNFIKPCKYVHICKTNTLSKKVRARGQFY